MIRVVFTEPATPEWRKWRQDAAKAALAARATIDSGGRPKISAALYKRMRAAIYEVFHGKCAYCERKFILDQSGDVDHFRPKGGVTDDNDRLIMVVGKDGKRVPHPGYYWLAYEWTNLLPTCAKCNRPARLPSGKLVGKSTRFPVQGEHAWRPGDEGKEAPLFLHPVFDTPDQHLVLETSTGVIAARSPRGQTCIDLLDLNREGLPEERRKRYTEIKGRLLSAVGAALYGRMEESAAEIAVCERYRSGTEELSWAARIALEEAEERLAPVRQLTHSAPLPATRRRTRLRAVAGQQLRVPDPGMTTI